MSKNRHDFKETDKRLLAERVGYHCSNPSCGVSTVGPSDISTNKEYVGVAAHIYSASIDNGPRANPNLTEKERSSITNGIHLCNKCSTLIDKNNGDGYSAELLINWKRAAEDAARKRIYTNTNASVNIYKLVNFNNLEQQYSTALTGIGLSEKHVCSCPENKELITEVVRKLNLANKCILFGRSGSGKSLLTYQIAYHYYGMNWSIYKFNKESIINTNELVAPKAKSVLIIDDIQTIPAEDIENLLESAYEDFKILANFNTDAGDDKEFNGYPNVQIILSTQIAILKKFCLKNKHLIAQKLQSSGLNIQSNSDYDCIEARIERAAREKTPWLYNYNLTEGWNSAKQDLKFLKENDFQHLVIITVAIYQFVTLDLGGVERVIISALEKYDSSLSWINKAKKTIKENCLTDEGTIRNKHYEYSRKLLQIFVNDKEYKEEISFLINLIKDILYSNEYIAGHSNLLEFILFDFEWCQQLFKNDGVFLDLGKQLIKSDTIFSYSVVNKLNSTIRNNPKVIQLLIPQKYKIYEWLTSCTRDNAYSFGDLLNTLHNEGIGEIDSGKKVFISIFDLMRKSRVEDYSRFSFLLNRLALFLTKEDRNEAIKILEGSNFSVSITSSSTGIACFNFSSVIKDFMYLSKKWVDYQVCSNIKGIAYFFNKDFKNALEDFQELLSNYFGIYAAILSSNKPTGKTKKIGKDLVSYLDINSIINGFDNIKASEVQKYGYILIFLTLYDKTKLMSISENFNYARLQSLFSGYTKVDHYHRALVCILRNDNSQNWKKHAEWLINSVQYVERTFFFIDSKTSLNRIKNSISYEINIHMSSDCEEELMILKIIKEELGREILLKVIHDNKESLTKAICTNVQNADNHKSKFDLLVFIYHYRVNIFTEIFNEKENCNAVCKKIERLHRGKKWERMIANLYAYFLRKHSSPDFNELAAIEKKFPSIRNFKIEEYTISNG